MSAHPPPVPPDQRAPHGGATAEGVAESRADRGRTAASRDVNTAEQGRAGNAKQNTTHTGTQQDR